MSNDVPNKYLFSQKLRTKESEEGRVLKALRKYSLLQGPIKNLSGDVG